MDQPSLREEWLLLDNGLEQLERVEREREIGCRSGWTRSLTSIALNSRHRGERAGWQTELEIVVPRWREGSINGGASQEEQFRARFGLIIQHRKEDRARFGCCKREGLNRRDAKGNLGAGEGLAAMRYDFSTVIAR